jgi:hypothetical protein
MLPPAVDLDLELRKKKCRYEEDDAEVVSASSLTPCSSNKESNSILFKKYLLD